MAGLLQRKDRLMRRRNTSFTFILCLISTAIFQSQASAQLLYAENFDDGNATDRWTANAGVGFDDPIDQVMPMDTNFDRAPLIGGVDGINDDFSGFAFDYSVHGIPSAPNSSGSSTVGLQLQANLFTNRLGGFSASPNGLNLTGDYSVTFDYWGSSIGPFPFGGSSSTMMSTFGVLTAGDTSQSILSADGIFFGAVADAGTGSDYRVYSAARNYSHQCNGSGDGSTGCEDQGPTDDIDKQATYHAGTRNGPGQLYLDAIGDPLDEGITVPQSVIDAVEAIYPSGDPENPTMGGPLFSGAPGFQWHEMEIRKQDNLIDWFMNGFKLITMDITDWDDPENTIVPGGGNISFGHADINFSSPGTQEAIDLVYTLIDNIEVNGLSVSDPSDTEPDGDVDGQDFLELQRSNPSGIADWQTAYPLPLSAVTAVPEPSTWGLAVFALVFLVFAGSPRRKLAFQRI